MNFNNMSIENDNDSEEEIPKQKQKVTKKKLNKKE